MLNSMDLNELAKLLAAYKSGGLETSDAVERIKNLHFEDIGFARVDHSRASRQGFPEVVFGGGKTRAQIVGIVDRLVQRSPNILVTRTDEGTFGEIRNVVADALPVDGDAVAMQQSGDPVHYRRHAARVKQVLHQILT